MICKVYAGDNAVKSFQMPFWTAIRIGWKKELDLGTVFLCGQFGSFDQLANKAGSLVLNKCTVHSSGYSWNEKCEGKAKQKVEDTD